jgi:hypothetical protein
MIKMTLRLETHKTPLPLPFWLLCFTNKKFNLFYFVHTYGQNNLRAYQEGTDRVPRHGLLLRLAMQQKTAPAFTHYTNAIDH